VKLLSEEITHHVREEEKSDGVLAKAKEAGVATSDLAKRMAGCKQELMAQAKAGNLGPPVMRTFRIRINTGTDQLSQEHKMARGSSATMERERDERGRFVGDDDDDRDYRRRLSSRGRYDDDDRRRSMPARDEEGRFTSARSRYDDGDDDYRRRGRGYGGWYGDPEGHSEASRRGWDNPDHGRSGWYGDPEGHSEASRRGWDEREGSRGRYRDDDRRRMPARDDEGRFVGSRSRYDDDDDDYRRRGRGHGGWYGDPEGHSEASLRGWEDRGGSRSRYRDDDDDRRYMRPRDDDGRFVSSRSRYDDEDDDGRRGRGHGGWYGDPEGHSEAARRGRR
jgi:hypothetical protein